MAGTYIRTFRRDPGSRLGGSLLAVMLGWLGTTACVSPSESDSLRAPGSGSDTDGGATGAGNASGSGTGAGNGTGTGTGGGGVILPGEDPPNNDGPDACAASSYQAEQIVTETIVEVPVEVQVPVTTEVQTPVTTVVNEPVAFYFMLDQSGSMNDTSGAGSKWSAAVSSINTFVNDPNSVDLNVAFNTFASGIAFLDFNCSGSQYANPHVPMARLPGNAVNVTNWLNSQGPTGTGTNIEPGLRAATDACIAHQTSTGERCIVIFISDGQPNVCSGDAALLSGVAGAAYTTHDVQTFAVAMAGSDFNLMNSIAIAGGTDCDPNGPNSACDIQANAAGLIDALNAIRETTVVTEYITETITEYVTEYHTETHVETQVVSTPVECEWVLPEPPEGETLDPNQVNVEVIVSGQTQRLGYLAASTDCANAEGGWYYDNATTPTKVLVCDQTCGVIQAVTESRVDLLLGCETEPAILH